MLVSINASLYEIILGCRIDASIRTSLRAFYFSLSDRLFKFTFFSAYSKLSSQRFTL